MMILNKFEAVPLHEMSPVNETELARTIVAHLAWRYRYKLRAYNLVRDNKNASKLLVDLAYCQIQEAFDAYYSSKRYVS
jgi:hypothetical protein